jgi:hypothetical protein
VCVDDSFVFKSKKSFLILGPYTFWSFLNNNEKLLHYCYYCLKNVWSQNSKKNCRYEEKISFDTYKEELLPDRLFSSDVELSIKNYNMQMRLMTWYAYNLPWRRIRWYNSLHFILSWHSEFLVWVQWQGLNLGELPCWSHVQCLLSQVIKYEEIHLSTNQSSEKNQNSSVLNQNYEENICYFEICFFNITGFLNLFS